MYKFPYKFTYLYTWVQKHSHVYMNTHIWYTWTCTYEQICNMTMHQVTYEYRHAKEWSHVHLNTHLHSTYVCTHTHVHMCTHQFMSELFKKDCACVCVRETETEREWDRQKQRDRLWRPEERVGPTGAGIIDNKWENQLTVCPQTSPCSLGHTCHPLPIK